jgi:hypothetical protein
VSRDAAGAGYGIVLLVFLVLLGVILFFSFGGLRLVAAGKEMPILLVVGLVGFGAILAGLFSITAGKKQGAGGRASGILGGVAIGAGVVLLVVTFSCLAVVAVFLETCGKCR